MGEVVKSADVLRDLPLPASFLSSYLAVLTAASGAAVMVDVRVEEVRRGTGESELSLLAKSNHTCKEPAYGCPHLSKGHK